MFEDWGGGGVVKIVSTREGRGGEGRSVPHYMPWLLWFIISGKAYPGIYKVKQQNPKILFFHFFTIGM